MSEKRGNLSQERIAEPVPTPERETEIAERYAAVQTVPGIGPTLGAVLIAEIGEVTRFATAAQLACWAGLTPKHHESDTKVRRGRITKQGSRLVRWAVVESVQILPKTSVVGQIRDRVAERRGRNIGVVAAARRQLEYVYYALRDGHVRALRAPARGVSRRWDRSARVVQVMTPTPGVVAPSD